MSPSETLKLHPKLETLLSLTWPYTCYCDFLGFISFSFFYEFNWTKLKLTDYFFWLGIVLSLSKAKKGGC